MLLLVALFVGSVLVGMAGVATVYLIRSPNRGVSATDSLPWRITFRIAAVLTFGFALLVLVMLGYVVYVITTGGSGR